MEKLTGVAFNSGGGGSALTVKYDGTTLTTGATSIDFTGAGVTATNTGTSVTVDIPGGGGGTVNTDGLTISGDGSSGDPLKTSIPVYNDIQLTSDYTMYNEGVYEVTVGTDFGDFHALTPPDPADYPGKRIVVTNKDRNLSVFFNGSVYFRGTTQAANVIPPLATYEYVSMDLTPPSSGWYWVCISPDYVVYPDIDLASLGSYTIYTYGTYTFLTGSILGSEKITFPNPEFFSGQSITIINKDNAYPIRIINDGSNPVYQGFGSTPFPDIDAGMTVEFISDGTLWRSKPFTQELTYLGIDLSVADYQLTTPGIYLISNPDGIYGIGFPNTAGMNGQTITVWNRSDATPANILDNGFRPITSDESAVTTISIWTVAIFKCIANQWVLVNTQ